MLPRGGRARFTPVLTTENANGSFVWRGLEISIGMPVTLNCSNQPVETMLVRSPTNHSQLYMFCPNGLLKLSRDASGKYVVLRSNTIQSITRFFPTGPRLVCSRW